MKKIIICYLLWENYQRIRFTNIFLFLFVFSLMKIQVESLNGAGL